jgi:cysteine desulfurase
MTYNLKLPIYLDYMATTPMDPKVLEQMIPYFTEKFGNPHSRTHKYGWEAEDAIEIARKNVADVLSCDKKEIIFTSGATESNNLAIKGIAHFYKDKGNHIITSQIEHKCVLDTLRNLEQEGFLVTYLPVNKEGLINIDELKSVMTDKTILVSIMAVNNELGVVQDLKSIGNACREKNVFFHTDIAQAFGKIPINVEEMNISLASISGHKIYGPKGIGALYIRKKPRVRLKALINGGGQERGFRSGTLPTPLIVGLGAAALIAKEQMSQDLERISTLHDYFINYILSHAKDVYVNGSSENKYKGCMNISFAYIEGESMILAIKDLAVSSGSACTSQSLEPSYVLKALGVDEEMAHTSIRFSIGRFTTKDEIEYAAKLVVSKINHLRELSPLWEMVQDGIDLKSIKWEHH